MNEKQIRARYTAEFKQEAVRQVKDGRAASVVAKTLGMPKAGLTNWVRAAAKEADKAAAGKAPMAPPITPEQAELARLKAEVARLRMERDIAKKAAVRSTGRCNSRPQCKGGRAKAQCLARPLVELPGDPIQLVL